MSRSVRILIFWVVIAATLGLVAGWLVARTDGCERFAMKVEGYVGALTDAGVPDGELASRSSAALRDEQPGGCDVL